MSALATAKDAWGEVPDWVEALACACDASSQNQVAKSLERSASMISTVIRNRYPASTDGIEELVRGKLMSEVYECPVLGEIGRDVCAKWRGRAKDFRPVNTQYVQMYRACQKCPQFLDRLTPKEDAA